MACSTSTIRSNSIDQKLRASTLGIATFSIGFVVIASLAVGFFIHRLVYLPLRDLESGAHRLSTGDLDQPIPVRSADEFGKLAISFNGMTEALRKSRGQLREWAHTLEQKVENRTQELRRAQAETMRGEKLASVGLLASGVAHELNNPLTGILTFSHLLRQKMPDKSADAEDMDLVIRETKRCAAIIKRLLDFAREKQPEKKFTDINQVIEDTVRIVERPAHLRDIEINMDLDRTLPPIWIDADQIKQVVMNMLVNAQHAVEEQGSIAISTRRADTPRITPQSGRAGADGGDHRSPIPAAAFRRRTCGASSIRFSPPRPSARAPAWDFPSATASSRAMAASSRCKARLARARHFAYFCPWRCRPAGPTANRAGAFNERANSGR